MPLYKPSELKAFLRSLGAAPLKHLSQNFLIDGNIVRKIIDFAGVQKGDCILEIGPGPGVITEALLEQGASVVAIEKDFKFSQALLRLQTQDHRLTLFEQDALKWEPSHHLPQGFRAKVIGNLPYHITTPLLTRFLPKYDIFSSITVMMQKEVADRILASPGSKLYSSLSIFVRFYAEPIKGFIIEPSCFYPQPKVQSSMIQFALKNPPLENVDSFFPLLRTAFQHRRKMIRASLKNIYPFEKIEAGLKKIGKGMDLRPEQLDLADFLVLFKEIDQRYDYLSS
jgi:16S rRNA (adenine1518-N6/adenine1519-N6)-dimethyltransferase